MDLAMWGDWNQTWLDRIGQDEDQIYANVNGNNNARMDDRSYFQKDSYQRSPPDMDRQPAQNRSPQKRPHSFQGRSYHRGEDTPDFADNSLRRLSQARNVSHYSSSTADSHESMERLHPRKRSNLEEPYLSDEDDEGRSYHLSDIVSSPDVSPSRVSKKSYQSSPRHRERSRSPARWDRPTSRQMSRQTSRPTSRSSQVYERLRERREKLSLLREQLGIRQPNPPPVFPVYQSESDAAQSDIEDIKRNIRELRRRGRSHKSLLSIESTQEGSYHPGRMTPASSLPSIPNALYEERYHDHHPRLHSPPRFQGADPYFSDDYRRRGHNRSRHRNGDFENRRPPRQTAKKLKKLFGPEFVIMSSAPKETIDMAPSMMCKMGKVPPERKQVVVALLNGKCVDLMCDLGTSGQELFDMVAAHLQLSERFYFGLAFIKDGEYMFLDPDAKIYKVGPDSWRAEMKKGTLRSTISRDKLTLFFRVKFYADSVNVLKNLDHIARHNFYLQLRRDVLEERVKCTEGEAIQLASLALQAEMGDYDHERMAQNYFLPEHYVPAEIIERTGVSSIRRKLAILHQGHESMTEEEAEFEYLMEARKLSEYGIHFHKVAKSKKSPKQSVWLGICARGVIVYDKNGSQRSQIHAHPWPATKKVAFKKKKFVVEPNDSSGFKFVHYTDNYKKGKYLLQLCKAQHRFHMTMRTKAQIAQRFHDEFPSPMKYNTPVRQSDFGYDVHFSDDDDEDLIVEDYGDDYNYPPNNREPYPVASEPALNMMEDPYSQHPRAQSHMERRGETLPDNSRGRSLRGRRSHLSKARSVDTGRQLLDDGDDPLLGRERPLSSQARSRNRNYESYSEDDFSSQEDMHGNGRDEPNWPNAVGEEYRRPMRLADGEDEELEEGPYATIDSIRERKRESMKQNYRKNSPPRPQRSTNHPYVVDTSIHTRGDPHQKIASPKRSLASPLSETLQNRLNEMPTPEVPERDIVIVTLKKDPRLGLGLTIIGGENSGSLDLGIFVQEVMADGPADRDGRIFPGDRIISINGQSLEGVGHKVAVDVIQKTPEVVQLILSQPRRKQISPEHKSIEGSGPLEAPYANITELRRHSTGGYSKVPPDRKPQRSVSAVSASGSISKQTPPTKPRRKPQTFGSSYSLVNSDSEAGTSETEQRKPERPSGSRELETANRGRKPPTVSPTMQESGKDSNVSSENVLKNKDSQVKDRRTKSSQQNSSENVQMMDHQPSQEKSFHDGSIRGFSPTLDVDFDDNFSDDVPTPESSELEDLFGDEEEKKKWPEINLRKSMNMSPSLSGDEKMDAENNVGDSETKKRDADSKTGGEVANEELVASALKPGDVFTVQLTKKNGSLGISVTGGINTSVKHGGIYVKTMVPGGAAEEEGQIQPGDRVLQVDKYSLKNVTHKQAVEILRKVPEESVLKVERGNPPARTNTLPPTPVHFKEASEVQEEGTVSAATEKQLKQPPMKDIMSAGEAPIPNEEEILNENTLRFSPPPEEADTHNDKPLGYLPSNQMDSLRTTDQSPGTTTPTIEALNDENENTTGDEDEEGSQTEDEEQSEGDESEADSEDGEATESDIPSDDFPEDDDLYAEIASPALSTREADTLTPTAHLMMTPTRGLFGMRNQGNMRGQQNWVHRKSIDDDDRYSSAVSESTNARSPSPTSSYLPEDEGNVRSGFQAFRRQNENQTRDADSNSFRRVMRSPFDGGRKALEIEPSMLPVMMEEEPAELEGLSTANSMDNVVQGPMTSKSQSPSKDESREKLDLSEEPKSLSHHPEAIDQSSYQPTMVTMDSKLMSPMSTVDSVGALSLTQTLLADPDATSDVELPDVPYATLDNCFEIELVKGEQGLGLSVQGGVGAHLDPRFCTVRIKKIFPGQAAAKSGLVEEGDIILAVNGEHVHNAVHSEVVTKLRNSSQTVRLLICRPSQEELNTLLLKHNEKKKQPSLKDNLAGRKEVQPLPTIPGANKNSPTSSPLLSPMADKSEVTSHNSSVEFGSSELLSFSESSPRRKVQENDATEVTLVKPVRGGLGFTVAGGVNTGGCYIKDIITDPALSDGRLMKGDKIISVNGKDMTKMNHFEAVTFLRMTPREVTLKVKRPVNRYDLASPSPEKQYPSSTPRSDSQASIIPPLNDFDEDGDSEDNEPLRMDEIERLTPKTVATKSKVQEDENEMLRKQLQSYPVITLRCKKGEDVGIRLASDSDSQKPLIRVSLIQQGSLAYHEGSIQVNDEVKSINGHLVNGQSLAETQKLLSENVEVVQLQLSRNGLPVHPISKDVAGPAVTASNSVNDSHVQEGRLNGEKTKEDDSDIDLGDVSAEESWEDMSSEKSSEEDLDAMLAALTPVHSTRGGSAKDNINVVKKDQEQQLKKEDKTMEDPPVNNTKSPEKISERPPPVPEAPPPPLTPTSEHSPTREHSPTLEHSPTPEDCPIPSQLPNSSENLVEATGEVSSDNEKVQATSQNDVYNTALEEGEEERRKAEEERREAEKQNSNSRRLDEDDVEQSVLNDIMNQEDSIDDITFADMISSGDEYEEETDEARSDKDEDDFEDKQDSNQKQSEENLKLDDKDPVKRNVTIPSSQKLMSSDLSLKDIGQMSASNQTSIIAPSPVVVNPPPQRVSSPQDLTVSTSDEESSLSLALPSIEEDPPPRIKVASLSQQSNKQEEKLETDSREETPEPFPTANESPVTSPVSVNSEFSFGDSLPIPSSPVESRSTRDDIGNSVKVAKSVDKYGQVANPELGPSEVRQQGDDSENKDVEGDSAASQQSSSSSPVSESKLPSMETSPQDVSFGRNRETPLQEISSRDTRPPLQKQSEEKRDVASPKVSSDTLIPKSSLEAESRIVPEEESIVPSSVVAPLRRPPSTISEGLSASEGGVYWVELTKPTTGGLGLSLVGAEKGGKTSVFVKTVTPGGVTDLDGRIKVGDKMLQVNGQSTVGMTQKKVISLLRKVQGTVKLALSSGKPPSRPSSFVTMDSHKDTDREEPPPTVPPLDLPRDTTVSDSDPERTATRRVEEAEENISDLSSLASSTDGKDVQSEMKGDRDTASDVDSTAELPDDSLLDLLDDDSGNAVAMETALRATRQIGKVLKDKIQGKEDISFGSDIGFPLSSENSSPLPSEGEQSERSHTDRSNAGIRTSILTEGELTAMKILQVPSGCKLYSGKSIQSIISGLQKQIDKHDPEEEFKMLRQVKAADACEVARKPENRDKNRFRNVLPYDKTRVVLQSSDTDYVNASHIQVRVNSSEYHYIACQGPLPQTTKDFWAMVWEQGVEVIAMVTLDYENGKVKCHKYWPEKKDSVLKIHHFEIKLEEVSKLDHFHIRHLTITHTESKESHRVTHLNFTSWPDHSVPDSALPLLRFTRYMRKIGGEFNPVIVHCSAGIGRTGTLMTIDIVLNMIEADQEFKIEEIVRGLRLQRQGMIQTKDQYLFCYKAVIDALKTL